MEDTTIIVPIYGDTGSGELEVVKLLKTNTRKVPWKAITMFVDILNDYNKQEALDGSPNGSSLKDIPGLYFFIESRISSIMMEVFDDYDSYDIDYIDADDLARFINIFYDFFESIMNSLDVDEVKSEDKGSSNDDGFGISFSDNIFTLEFTSCKILGMNVLELREYPAVEVIRALVSLSSMNVNFGNENRGSENKVVRRNAANNPNSPLRSF